MRGKKLRVLGPNRSVGVEDVATSRRRGESYQAIRLMLAFGLLLLIAPSFALAHDFVDGEMVVGLVPGASIEDVNARWGTTTLDSLEESNLYLIEFFGEDDDLETDPDVLYANHNSVEDTPEGVRQLVLIAVGGEFGDYADQELTERIGLSVAHTQSRGAGITIALLDTGVDPDHEALVGRLSPLGYDFVDDDVTPWETANGIDEDQDGLTDEAYGHGTMVAGVLALVAPEAEILPIRVLDDDGRGDAFTICKAIRYAANRGADIFNLSFGTPSEIEAVETQMEIVLEDHGMVGIGAAGNESRQELPYYPAAEEIAIMVTAVDTLDVKADFADWGDKIDLCAPGVGVRSAYPDGQWAIGSGCSFATPFVTGAAALFLAEDPSLNPEELMERVRDAVEGIDHLPGNEPYGDRLGSGRLYLPAGFDIPTSGIEESLVEVGIRVFPNPSRGHVTIQTARSTDERVRILDALGREVHTLDAKAGGVVWNGVGSNGQPVPTGVYWVRPIDSERRGVAIRVVR